MKEDYQQVLQKLTLSFVSNLVPFNRQNYQTQKGSGTSDQSLSRLQNKFKNIPLFVTYYLTKFDDVVQSSFSVIPKFTFANNCTSICPFDSGKCGKEGKKLETFEYLENEKLF